LLGLAEPLAHEGQDEVFFTFEVIIVFHTKGNDVTQHMALQAWRKGQLGREGLQEGRQVAKERVQMLVL
jgi:hypothetical protein